MQLRLSRRLPLLKGQSSRLSSLHGRPKALARQLAVRVAALLHLPGPPNLTYIYPPDPAKKNKVVRKLNIRTM